MSLSLVRSRALLGLDARPVQVEVHLANGLPSFTLVGLADTEVKEARERVRSAIANAGLEFPSNKRITVNLAPADLPKDSGRFDLPIALGILAASGQISAARPSLPTGNSPASSRSAASCARCAARSP
jgi:magnesium chelatase family protein